MNAKDSDVDAMRKEFVSRQEFDFAQQQIADLIQMVVNKIAPIRADICPTCGLPSNHKLTAGDSDDA